MRFSRQRNTEAAGKDNAMLSFFETLTEYFQDPFLSGVIAKALIIGVPVALCASLLGVSLVLKRFSMIGDGLSHVGFGALAVTTLLNFGASPDSPSTLIISLPIVMAAAFFLLRISQNSRINGDAAIALVSTGAIAIGYLLFHLSGNGGPADVCSSLFGRSTILSIDDAILPISLLLSAAVLTLYLISYTKIFSITFDENFASATGVKTKRYNLLIALLTAVTIVLGMQLVGAIMISGLIVFPTLTAMRVCKSFRGVVVTAAVISVSCFVTGFFLATVYDIPTGPSVITVNLVLFLIFSLFSAVLRRVKK